MTKLENRSSSKTQNPRWIPEWSHRRCEAERHVLSIIANLEIEIDESLRQLDELYTQHADLYTPEDWQHTVTSLTYEIQQRCVTIAEHLENCRSQRSEI